MTNGTAATLSSVREFLRGASVTDLPLDELEITYIQSGPHGLERAVFELPASTGRSLRVAACRVKADRGPRLESEINERTAQTVAGSGFDRAALYAPTLDLLFQVFPADGRLPSLAVAVDAVRMIPVLESALGGRLESVEPRVVKYKPERKCVLRYELTWRGPRPPAAPSVVWGRVARRAKFERTHDTLPRVYEAAGAIGFELPAPLGVVPELAMELMASVPGVQLFELVAREEFPAICRRTGEYLRQFHDLDVDVGEIFGVPEQIARLDENAAELGWLLPAERPRIDRLAREVSARLRELPPSPLRLIHRDFHGGNILVAGDHLSLLDFEDCGLGDPADDIASNWAQLTRYALRGGPTRGTIEAGRRAFVEGCSLEGTATAERLPAYAAMHGFLAAHQGLRHPRDDNRESAAAALLAVGERVLERGLPDLL